MLAIMLGIYRRVNTGRTFPGLASPACQISGVGLFKLGTLLVTTRIVGAAVTIVPNTVAIPVAVGAVWYAVAVAVATPPVSAVEMPAVVALLPSRC